MKSLFLWPISKFRINRWFFQHVYTLVSRLKKVHPLSSTPAQSISFTPLLSDVCFVSEAQKIWRRLNAEPFALFYVCVLRRESWCDPILTLTAQLCVYAEFFCPACSNSYQFFVTCLATMTNWFFCFYGENTNFRELCFSFSRSTHCWQSAFCLLILLYILTSYKIV